MHKNIIRIKKEKGNYLIFSSEGMIGFSSEPYGDLDCPNFNLCLGGCRASGFYATGKSQCDPYYWIKNKP